MANIWQDKKLVSVMSTNCQPTGPTTVRRKQKDGQVKSVTCPPNVVAYNKFMGGGGGVDRCDQLRGYYRLRTKSKKCYKYIFWFLFECCIVNAFTLVKHYCPVTISNRQAVIKDFRQQLALRLIGQYNTRQRYALPGPILEAASQDCVPPPAKCRAGATTQEREGHFPIKGPTARCHWCWNYRNHRRHESSMHCRQCGKAFCLVSRTVPMVPLALRGTTLDSYNIYNPLCSFAAAL